jgi:hypothetical protein
MACATALIRAFIRADFGFKSFGVRAVESHISKWGRPEFPVRSSGKDRVCAFLKGKAHEVQGTHETTQEIGDVGHPCPGWGESFKGPTVRCGDLREPEGALQTLQKSAKSATKAQKAPPELLPVLRSQEK